MGYLKFSHKFGQEKGLIIHLYCMKHAKHALDLGVSGVKLLEIINALIYSGSYVWRTGGKYLMIFELPDPQKLIHCLAKNAYWLTSLINIPCLFS